MACFEDLPSEVLLLLPLQLEDLLSSILVNRRLRKLHSPLLYQKVKIDGDQPGSADRLACFVKTIVSSPQLASAVHELYLKEWDGEISRNTAIHIDQTLACSPWENERSSHRRGRNHISLFGDEIASFLVSNLPNLSIIKLQYGNHFFSIADAATLKLSMINLRRDSYGTNPRIPMTEFLHFLTLPTLTAFSAPGCVDSNDSGSMLHMLRPAGTSKIRTLRLNVTDMSDSTFLAIMSYPATLMKLHLLRRLDSMCDHPERHQIKCQTVTQAIHQFKDHLEVLTLFKTQKWACRCGSDLLGSLRTLSKLRQLKLNPKLLVGGSLRSVSAYNVCYLLPSTLKEITLYIDQSLNTSRWDHWARLITELARRILQPDLEAIELDYNINPRRMTCKLCDWSAVYCFRCDEDDGTICPLCYRSEYVQKLAVICKAAGIQLFGSWNENFTDHPLDHAPSFTYSSVETDE